MVEGGKADRPVQEIFDAYVKNSNPFECVLVVYKMGFLDGLIAGEKVAQETLEELRVRVMNIREPKR